MALGGHRRFTGNEFELAERVGHPEPTGEYDALDTGTRAAFAPGAPETVEGEESELVGGTWGVRQYRTADGLRVAVAVAPSGEPGRRRANTPDSYDWFATRFAKLTPGQRVLAVTTPIHVPAQQAAALRMLGLPYGVDVETIGIDPAAVPAALEQTFSPTKYLLEIRSTVRALRTLLTALRERGQRATGYQFLEGSASGKCRIAWRNAGPGSPDGGGNADSGGLRACPQIGRTGR